MRELRARHAAAGDERRPERRGVPRADRLQVHLLPYRGEPHGLRGQAVPDGIRRGVPDDRLDAGPRHDGHRRRRLHERPGAAGLRRHLEAGHAAAGHRLARHGALQQHRAPRSARRGQGPHLLGRARHEQRRRVHGGRASAAPTTATATTRTSCATAARRSSATVRTRTATARSTKGSPTAIPVLATARPGRAKTNPASAIRANASTATKTGSASPART